MQAKVTITYHAQEQVKRLSLQERAELRDILSEPEKLRGISQVVEPGKFVSRFGNDKRVYWQQSIGGSIVVRSVIAHSSLAA